jgi:hypothetical protein
VSGVRGNGSEAMGGWHWMDLKGIVLFYTQLCKHQESSICVLDCLYYGVRPLAGIAGYWAFLSIRALIKTY